MMDCQVVAELGVPDVLVMPWLASGTAALGELVALMLVVVLPKAPETKLFSLARAASSMVLICAAQALPAELTLRLLVIARSGEEIQQGAHPRDTASA